LTFKYQNRNNSKLINAYRVISIETISKAVIANNLKSKFYKTYS